MESRKRILRKEAEKTESKRCFIETLQTLQRELKQLKQEIRISSTPSIEQWYAQFVSFNFMITSCNESLMLKQIPILLDMQIPQFWVTGEFSDKSKSIIWKYIQQLSQCACTYCEDDGKKEESQVLEPDLSFMGEGAALFDTAPTAVKSILRKSAQAQMNGQVNSVEDFQRAVPLSEIQAATAQMMQDPAQMRAFFKMFSQIGPMADSMFAGR
jgi:hypothetical protein